MAAGRTAGSCWSTSGRPIAGSAGSGILHQEMPKGDPSGRMHGFQLWANLPASLKMTDPRYQDVTAAAIPEEAGRILRPPGPFTITSASLSWEARAS